MRCGSVSGAGHCSSSSVAATSHSRQATRSPPREAAVGSAVAVAAPPRRSPATRQPPEAEADRRAAGRRGRASCAVGGHTAWRLVPAQLVPAPPQVRIPALGAPQSNSAGFWRSKLSHGGLVRALRPTSPSAGLWTRVGSFTRAAGRATQNQTRVVLDWTRLDLRGALLHGQPAWR